MVKGVLAKKKVVRELTKFHGSCTLRSEVARGIDLDRLQGSEMDRMKKHGTISPNAMGPAPFDRKLREGSRLRLRCNPAINQIKRCKLGSSPLDICQMLLFGPFQGTWIYCNRFLAQFRTEWCRSHGIWYRFRPLGAGPI